MRAALVPPLAADPREGVLVVLLIDGRGLGRRLPEALIGRSWLAEGLLGPDVVRRLVVATLTTELEPHVGLARLATGLLTAVLLGALLLAAVLLNTGALRSRLLPAELLTARLSAALLCPLPAALSLHLIPPLPSAGRLSLGPLPLVGLLGPLLLPALHRLASPRRPTALRGGPSLFALGRPLFGRRPRAGLLTRRLLARRRVPPHRLAGRLLVRLRLASTAPSALLAPTGLLTLPGLLTAPVLLGAPARLPVLSGLALLRPLSAPSPATSLLRLRALACLPSLAGLSPLRRLTVLGLAAVALGLLLAPVCVPGSLVSLSTRLSPVAGVALRSSLIARRLIGLLVDVLIPLAAPTVVVVVVSHGFN